MAYMIEITDNELEDLAEYTGKMLCYGGKIMSHLDRLRNRDNDDSDRDDERSGMRNGDSRSGMRNDYNYDYEVDRYGERRGRRRY